MEEVWGYNGKGFAICGPIQDMVLRLFFFFNIPISSFFFKSPCSALQYLQIPGLLKTVGFRNLFLHGIKQNF